MTKSNVEAWAPGSISLEQDIDLAETSSSKQRATLSRVLRNRIDLEYRHEELRLAGRQATGEDAAEIAAQLQQLATEEFMLNRQIRALRQAILVSQLRLVELKPEG